MGNFTSKLFYNRENSPGKAYNESDFNTSLKYSLTPPMKRRILPIDPRSATMGIPRTPINVTPTPPKLSNHTISAIPKHLQNKPYLETNFDETIPSSRYKDEFNQRSSNVSQSRTPVMVLNMKGSIKTSKYEIIDMHNKVICCDPRSPAVDFDRTPILKPRSPKHLRSRSQEDLKSANNFLSNTPSRLSYCETTTSFNIPEIQALSDIIQDSQLISEKYVSPNSSYSSTIDEFRNESLNDEVVESINSEEIKANGSPVLDKYAILKLSTKDVIDNILIAAMKKVELQYKNGTGDEKIRIWRDPESFDEKDGEAKRICKESVSKEDIIIEFDDNSVLDDKKETVDGKIEEHMKKQDLLENKKKNDGKYVNKNVVKCRTPLGNRSNNHALVHAKLVQSPQQLFRGKGNTTKVQQENTPPNKKFAPKIKLNGTIWDPDSTVVI